MRNIVGVFGRWQPLYAAHGIATFPVGPNKVPLVRNWNRFGAKVSAELVSRFADAPGIGFVTGKRSCVTIVDIDTTDEAVVREALERHGEPGVIVRTGSGKLHHWYRYAHEGRHIRPHGKDLPIDVLGDNGYAIEPGSETEKGCYEFIKGGLDDIGLLVPMRNPPARERRKVNKAKLEEKIADGEVLSEGERNNLLFRATMQTAAQRRRAGEWRLASAQGNLNFLIDQARSLNANRCHPPLPEEEVVNVAHSAFGYESRGENAFGRHLAMVFVEDFTLLSMDAILLLTYLKAHNGPDASFMCANEGMCEIMGWGERRLRAARAELIEKSYMREVRPAAQRRPALYRWSKRPV